MAINYKEVGWKNGSYVNPTSMNKMDSGIKSACDGVDKLNGKVVPATSTKVGLVKPDGTTIKVDADGTLHGANTYELPVATESILGGVTIGSNISVSNGKISLIKSNVTSALGYTPPTTDTTYSVATTSANGLMSSSDKSKLDGIATGANKTSIANNLTTTSSGYALDARQGKALNDRVSKLETWTNSGNWWYRIIGSISVSGVTKYIYECHYKATHSVATTSSYGNMYYNSTRVNISYPLSGRIGTLSQTATAKAGNGLFFVNINDYTSEGVLLWIASAKSGTYDIEINLHCFIY